MSYMPSDEDERCVLCGDNICDECGECSECGDCDCPQCWDCGECLGCWGSDVHPTLCVDCAGE